MGVVWIVGNGLGWCGCMLGRCCWGRFEKFGIVFFPVVVLVKVGIEVDG